MTRMWAVVGDATSSGGRIITGSQFTDIDGKPVARVSDKATCPTHKGTFPIVDGDPTTIIDGQAVALHGSSLACGCKVLAVQQTRVFLNAAANDGSNRRQSGSVASNTAPTPKYDEQIQFLGPTGKPLAGLAYALNLEDGSLVRGVSDDAGRTRRVATPTPLGIIGAELEPPENAPSCCAGMALPAQRVLVPLAGAVTHASQVGSSTHQAKVQAEDRGLTAGEITMLRQVFGAAVDYSAVKIHNHGYWLFFGFQPADTATAPDGEIYMPADLFSKDYSSELNDRQHLLVHEMTHVWQFQLGYPVKRVRAPRPNMSYAYDLGSNRTLRDHNMEAQGNLIADYFLVKFRADQPNIAEIRYRRTPNLQASYERALKDFIANPANPKNLPMVTQ